MPGAKLPGDARLQHEDLLRLWRRRWPWTRCVRLWALAELAAPPFRNRCRSRGSSEQRRPIPLSNKTTKKEVLFTPLTAREGGRLLCRGRPFEHMLGQDDIACQLCMGLESTPENEIVLCGSAVEGCGQGWHMRCVGLDVLPAGDWFCPSCRGAQTPAGSSGKGDGRVAPTNKSLAVTPSASGPSKQSQGRTSTSLGSAFANPSRLRASDVEQEPEIEGMIESGLTPLSKGHHSVMRRPPPFVPTPAGAHRAKCKLCFRNFMSQHALDVHLTRNQICRRENEKRKLKRKSDMIERRFVSRGRGGEGSADYSGGRHHYEGPRQASGPRPLDLANQIISRLMQSQGAQPFNLPVDPTDADAKQYFSIIDPAVAMDFSTIKNKLASGGYDRVHELQDDVLLIWRNCFRYYGPQSALYEQALALSKQFDEQMRQKMDQVRGLGGSADAQAFEHGPRWVGQDVRIYWPKEHERLAGKIEAHECTDGSTHRYHVVYPDGNQEWKALPDPHVELVGWVKPHEERLLVEARPSPSEEMGAGAYPGSTTSVDFKRAVALKGWETRRKRQLVDSSASSPNKMSRPQRGLPKREPAPTLKFGNQRHERGSWQGRGYDAKGSSGAGSRSHSQAVHTRGTGPGGTRRMLAALSANQIFLQLVRDLREKADFDFFDQPAHPKLAPGYYHCNPLARQRGITAWNTSCVSFEQMASTALRGEYADLSAVERDFNLLISNALIYHAHWHVRNREARRLFRAALQVFDGWARRKQGYCCQVCEHDDAKRDAVGEEAMLLCDQCCRGIHQSCFTKGGAKALALLSQETLHPLRGDSAFFCSHECRREFTSLAAHYKLGLVESTETERKSAFSAANALAESLSHSLASSAPSAKQLSLGKISIAHWKEGHAEAKGGGAGADKRPAEGGHSQAKQPESADVRPGRPGASGVQRVRAASWRRRPPALALASDAGLLEALTCQAAARQRRPCAIIELRPSTRRQGCCPGLSRLRDADDGWCGAGGASAAAAGDTLLTRFNQCMTMLVGALEGGPDAMCVVRVQEVPCPCQTLLLRLAA
jgi:hypothetical protein